MFLLDRQSRGITFLNEPITSDKLQTELQTQQVLSRPSFFLRAILILLVLSLIGCALLLMFDFFPALLPRLTHGPVSALPLLLIGVAYLGLQAILRPQVFELLKRVMLASAFILWGIDQLLPTGPIATTLGDIVIVLYIIDLALMMRNTLRTKFKPSSDS